MCSHRKPHFELVTNGQRDHVRFTKTAAFTEAEFVRREFRGARVEVIHVCL